MTYFRNENHNGSLNEELSNKGELNKYQGCVLGSFTPAGDFRRPDICSQEQEEVFFTEYVSFKLTIQISVWKGALLLTNPNQ